MRHGVSVLKSNDAAYEIIDGHELSVAPPSMLDPGAQAGLGQSMGNLQATQAVALRLGDFFGKSDRCRDSRDASSMMPLGSIIMWDLSSVVMPDLKSKGTMDGSTCRRCREASSTDTDVDFPRW